MAPNRPPKPGRCLLVMLRYPEPGKVKTRLAKVYGGRFAAELYGYFVDDLLQEMEHGDHHLELAFTPAAREAEIRERFGDRFSCTPQKGGGLGARMEESLRACFAKGFLTAVLIGSDFPDLTAEVIKDAFQSLENGHDAVIGPAFDGGYYLIGFRSETFAPAPFHKMRWGESSVFEKSVKSLRDLGYRIHLAPKWHDIDTGEDLEGLQARHRNTAFAHSRTMAFLRNRSGNPPPGRR